MPGLDTALDLIFNIQSQQAQKEQFEFQKEIYGAGVEEKIRAYEFNIGQLDIDIGRAKRTTGELIGDIGRYGARFQRAERAAMGAAGAAVGVGTPLFKMAETGADIQRGIQRAKISGAEWIEQLEAQQEFYEEEIPELEEQIEELKPKQIPKEHLIVGGGAQPYRPNHKKKRKTLVG